jgi:predicted nucleotidyltransferase
MTQDDVIEMAREAGLFYMDYIRVDSMKQLEDFAHLVADKATEEANAKANESWTLMCKKMVAIEREACAKVCDGLADMHEKMNQWGSHKTADTLAQAIRARGEQA